LTKLLEQKRDCESKEGEKQDLMTQQHVNDDLNFDEKKNYLIFEEILGNEKMM
jgi:hypothetical protein